MLKKYFLGFIDILFSITQIYSQNIINVPADYPTIQAAVNAAQSNDIILIQPGVYYEYVSFDGSGKTNISIVGTSRESTIIDAADTNLINVPNSLWENQGNNIFRTPFNHSVGDYPYASITDSILLFTYPTMQNFLEGYAGSGIYLDETSNYLYIYIENGQDPNQLPISVSKALAALYLRNCNSWKIKNLTFKHGARANVFFRYTCNDITFDSIATLNCKYGILHWGSSSNVEIKNSYFRSNINKSWSWVEVKQPPNGAPKTMEGSAIKLDYVLNSKIHNNEIYGTFDGIGLSNILAHGEINNQIYENKIHNIFDDAIELEEGGRLVQVFSNIIYDSFVGISLAPYEGGPHYIFRNEIITDKEILWDDSNGQDWRYGYIFKLGGKKLPSYNPEIKCENAKIYHNTFVGYRSVVQFAAYNDLWKDFEFYNNIFYSHLGYPIMDSGLSEEGNVYNSNLYFRYTHAILIKRWNDTVAGDFASLEVAKLSPPGVSSNWEENGIEADPLFKGVLPIVSEGSLVEISLKQESPAINSGIIINSDWPDVVGIVDSLPDIGAREYVSTLNVENEITPDHFVLYQNYPNPFNPATTIRYEIPEISFVTLKVYDILGREVTTLVNEEKPAGKYEIEFYAKGLPSGIYFYKMQVQELIQTKKMLFLK